MNSGHFDPDEHSARAALRAEQLPDDMRIEFGGLPDGVEAAHFPTSGTMRLMRGARRMTILHEGAHADHYRLLDLDRRSFPADAETQLGVLMLSEGFVGRRLASVAGFIVEGAKRSGQLAGNRCTASRSLRNRD